ncbi:MAG: helix-turn-helix transcriptional regulator [Anaerolineales bacterium]|nr:helix-turn-helix transcriptional regulator [Anaerolineales bacterium]
MQAIDHIHLKGELFTIGTFHCPTHYPYFHNTGPTEGHLVVFPRTPVCITQAGRRPVITDPNVVMFYNKGQEYQRDKISERGDTCEWFSFSPDVLVSAIQPYDAQVQGRRERPFRFSHGPSDPESYLQQRLITEYVRQTDASDMLYVEETLLATLNRVIENSYRARYGRSPDGKHTTHKEHLDLVHAVKTILATRYHEPLTVKQIATEVYSSPYHLCRVFQKITGLTIHAYRTQLRLHTSLECVAQPGTSLTQLSHALGFSSHSHFTASFRRTFGASPSTFRRSASTRSVRQMSNFLTV